MRPRFSVCVPAFNRVTLLAELLDSVLGQDFEDFEIIICEDVSSQRQQIRGLIETYKKKSLGKIRYFENTTNLGYDGNFRELISRSAGEYCFFLGNDDLMAPGALSEVDLHLKQVGNVGFVLRAYASFNESPEKIEQEFKYFPDFRIFEPGIDSILTCFRRSVVICGLVFHRDLADAVATSAYDGTLLYQQHLVVEVLKTKRAIYTPKILAFYRNGGVPEFGHSKKEQGRFVPGQQTPESSVHFMAGMLNIAKSKNPEFSGKLYAGVLRDLANYAYPFLAIQSRQKKWVFFKYYLSLCELNFGRFLIFHGYFWALFLMGSSRLDRLIKKIKQRLGYTPVIGSVYQGTKKGIDL